MISCFKIRNEWIKNKSVNALTYSLQAAVPLFGHWGAAVG